LRSMGVTDLVIDLESGNKQTLDFVNRKNSSLDSYLHTVDICISEGFRSIVTALIIGMPHETFETIATTITTLSKIEEVKVINTFPLVMREFDPVAKQILKNQTTGVSSVRRDQMWLFARDLLRDLGYVEGPISYFHPKTKKPKQQVDKFECVNLLGFGPSAFGYLNGADWAAQYYGHCTQASYAAAITAGSPGIWRAGFVNNTERARRKLIFGLANVKIENLKDIERVYGIDVDEVFGRELNALLSLGLIEIADNDCGIRYTEDGLSRLEEITYFLGSTFVKDRTDQLPDITDKEYKLLMNHHYTVTTAKEDRLAFERYAGSQSKSFKKHFASYAST
jgi:coproporphyrinogen III oxidase-like Fe-S oxidoreductase